MQTIKEMKNNATSKLKGKWEQIIAVSILYMLIMMATFCLFLGAGALLVEGPLLLGYVTYVLKLSRNQSPVYDDLFSAFKKFVVPALTYLLRWIKVFAFSLLLIVPGIIKGISYSMAMNILYDNPKITPKLALARSNQLMNGNKWNYTKFCLSFIGWWLLSIITLGLVYYLFFKPYFEMAKAEFYEQIKNGEKVEKASSVEVESGEKNSTKKKKKNSTAKSTDDSNVKNEEKKEVE